MNFVNIAASTFADTFVGTAVGLGQMAALIFNNE
jgi:hypothetical protein